MKTVPLREETVAQTLGQPALVRLGTIHAPACVNPWQPYGPLPAGVTIDPTVKRAPADGAAPELFAPVRASRPGRFQLEFERHSPGGYGPAERVLATIDFAL